jgi:capsular polysaccharide biosynthesis protein
LQKGHTVINEARGRRHVGLKLSRRVQNVLAGVLAVIIVALGGLAGLLVHHSITPTYASSTTVLVLPTATGVDATTGGGQSSAEVQIETESQLLLSASVAQAAADSLKGELSSKELLRNSSVNVPPNSQVMILTLLAGTPEKARDGSEAMAQAYLDRRKSEAEREVAGMETALKAQLADLSARLKDVTNQVANVPSDKPAQAALLESQRALLVDSTSGINARLVALNIQNAPGGEIVTKASLPDKPTSASRLVTVVGGLVVGLLAAIGLLMGLNRIRDRHPAAAEDPNSSRVPVLATLALSQPLAPGELATPGQLAHFVDEDEVLRRLCVKIASFPGVPGPTVIVGVGDPLLRTRVGMGLNRSWAAEFGGSVLVLTEAGDHVAAAGVSPDDRGLRDALREDTGILNSAVVGIGSYAGVVGPGQDAHLVPSAAQRGLLPEVWEQLEGEFGSVLVESGSPLDSPLAQSVAQSAGRFVVLVEVGLGQRRDLTSTLEEIEWLTLADRVAGVVIVSNRPAPVLGDGEESPGHLNSDRTTDISRAPREQR